MHKIKYVYLAGPITGGTDSSITSWREQIKKLVAKDIICLTPTRDVVDTSEDRELTIEKIQHGKGIVTRDRMDVARSDLILANFLGANKISIGSVGEIFWADAFRKPILLVIEDNNPHFHLMVLELAVWRYDNLKDAVHKINTLLSDLPFVP